MGKLCFHKASTIMSEKEALRNLEKETLQNLIRGFSGFESWGLQKQLPLIAWFLHRVSKQQIFAEEDIRRCFHYLDFKFLPDPKLVKEELSRCPNIVRSFQGYHDGIGYREQTGYKLNFRTCDKYDKHLLSTSRFIEIDKLLKALPSQIAITEEKTFLEETIQCYSCGANRAAIVMCWNLTFSHVCHFVLKDPSRLTSFNKQLSIKFPKATMINTFDDFSRFKESEVLDVCYSAKLVNKNQYKILKEKLDRRNMAAHPSTVRFTQIDVEHYILDLINNVVLAL
jgi:hypothetical protein